MGLVKIYENELLRDERGYLSKFVSFEKVLQTSPFPLQEVFKSSTGAGIVRGMHFQGGHSSNSRVIHLMKGHLITYFIDLRSDSHTFGEIERIETLDEISRTFVVPAGIAHGYFALTESEVLYLSDRAHDPKEDFGVNPLSKEFDWPCVPRVISQRDLALPILSDYLSSKTN
jgi:dTDP-4-dehydrorhamnose 3,5-epimerase